MLLNIEDNCIEIATHNTMKNILENAIKDAIYAIMSAIADSEDAFANVMSTLMRTALMII